MDDFYNSNNETEYKNENSTDVTDFDNNSDAAPVAASDLPSVPVVSSKKNDNPKKFIILLCLICAIVGGIAGGAVSGFFLRKGSDTESVVTTNQVISDTTATTAVSVDSDEKTDDETQLIQSGIVDVPENAPSVTEVLTAKKIYSENVDSVVGIEAVTSRGSSYGTGFIISGKGYVVTNFHVVDGGSKYIVTTYNDKEYNASLVGYEQSNDIAVLKITTNDSLHSLVYGESSVLSVGDPVYIIGNPLGDLTFTLTTGVVSALNRLITVDDSSMINMFQTDAAVNSGNSGGPVFDEHGYVVGIASAKYAASSIEGLSFCIPIDDVRTMIDEIINNGYVSGKALMGVSVYDTVIANYGFIQSTRSMNGAKVAAVGTNKAVINSGIKVDDLIISVDGENVDSVSKLKTILSFHRSGDTVNLTVFRDNQNVSLTMTFDEYTPTSARTQYSNVYDL